MRRAGAVVGAAIELLKASVEPGITTKDLDKIAYKEITRQGAKPTFMGYRGFPASICTSVNEEIVHGIPGKRVLREGDIVKVDVGATIEGMIGDAAVSIAVGQVAPEVTALMDDTRLGLEEGIKAAQPGGRIGQSEVADCGVEPVGIADRGYVGIFGDPALGTAGVDPGGQPCLNAARADEPVAAPQRHQDHDNAD